MCLWEEGIYNNDRGIGRLRGTKDSATMTDASSEDEGYVTRPRDQRQQQRRRGLDDGSKEYTKTTEAPKEEYEHKDYNKYNGCVGGG